MTVFPEISRITRDKYHNLEHDDMVKSIFNLGKHKAGVGMKIPNSMITDEMKLTENYRMYAAVFRVDVPMTQSQPIESTQGTHRTPNPEVSKGEYSAQPKSAVPRLHIEKVKEHLEAEEIEKMGRSREYKESSEVEITTVVQSVNVIEEEDESAEDDYELRRREKGKNEEEPRNTPSPTPIRSPRIHSTLISSDTELGIDEQQYQLYLTMKDDLQMQRDDISIWLALKIKFERPIATNTPCRSSAICLRDQDDPHDDAYPEGENTDESDPSLSTSGNQEQEDDSDFWTDRYATDDDEIPVEKVSQEHVEEMSETIDKAKLHKKRSLPQPQKPTPVVLSYQRDPKAPAQSLVNQDFLYPKKGNSGSKKFVLSLHKFPGAIFRFIFSYEDIEEKTSNREYNNDVKHGYVTPSLNKDDVEYLRLLDEEIEERLKHRDQMRRWEMYANGRPLGSRRERTV
ncbi:hypothetical protein Tco_1040314 [Tanacetum coccineum]